MFSAFDLITNITLLLTTIVIMLIYSPLLTLAGIGLSLVPFIGAIIVGGKLAFHEKEISDQNASFMHFVKDNLIGFSTVKVFKSENKRKFFIHNWSELIAAIPFDLIMFPLVLNYEYFLSFLLLILYYLKPLL